MRLSIFDTIDSTLTLLDERNELYHELEQQLKEYLYAIFSDDSEMIVDIFSRVKTRESLREKIIRNRFYINYKSSEEILDNLSDLIGVSIECRFIEEEYKVLKRLREYFIIHDEASDYYYNENHPELFLDASSRQPQVQKNGFSIYRIDGFILHDDLKINFELQIKALVHAFWGDIEHKLVYKNTNYYVYDSFMIDILSSIKANLTIIDRQLSIIYNQMQNSSMSDVSISEKSFEKIVTKAINDLFAMKMNESIGFTINLKSTSSILGHYIFIKDIRHSSISNDRISLLFKTFKKVNNSQMDFENEIVLDGDFSSNDIFIQTLGEYLVSVINIDYDWYVFFKMLFFIEPGNNTEDFILFLKVIKNYLVDDYWLKTSFVRLSMSESIMVQDECAAILARSLVEIGTIAIIDDEKMIAVNKAFVLFIQELENRVINYSDFMNYKEAYFHDWLNRMSHIFNR